MTAPLSRLAVDVELPQPGLFNRISNPTGEGGSVAGWVTPISSTLLKATNTTGGADDHGIAGWKLIYVSSAAATQYFYSLPFLVTPGHYIAGRWKAPYCDNWYSQRFEFLADDKATVVATSVITQRRQASGALRSVSAISQVPGTAVYARIRFDYHQGQFGSLTPSAGSDLILQDVEVATATTKAAIGGTRTNIVTNGGAEDVTNNTNNMAAANATLARVTTTPKTGAAAWRIQASGATASITWRSFIPSALQTTQAAGVPVAVAASVRPVTTVRTFRIDVVYDTPFLTDQIVSSPVFNEIAGAYADATHTFMTLPADATVTDVNVVVLGAPTLVAGEQHLIEDVQCLIGEAAAGVVFNHLTPDADGITYEWFSAGTASSYNGAVEHTFTATVVPSATFWEEITGPHGEVKIVRRPLDAGTLATVLKPDQLPAGIDPELRPGTGYRVRLDDEPLISAVVTGREPLDSKAAIPPVQVAAADAGRILVATPKTSGVGALSELAWVLEDTGVEWLINGSSAQVATPSVTATNVNAKAIDQIAMTRDLKLPAYAWISRDGIAVVNAQANLNPAEQALIDEDDMSYFEQGFDVQSCINIVTVKVGATTYGPFSNQVSIAKWGERPCTLTLQGVTSTVAQTVAQALLAANADPAFQVLAVTVPITRADQDAIALLDLYDLVRVQHAASGTDQLLRVAEVVHEITPTRWLLKLRFVLPGLCAVPQVIPEP